MSFAPDPKNTILLAGYQGAGTRGAALASGARTLKIHGRQVKIKAEVARLSMASAHADQSELLDWLKGIGGPPGEVFLVHGEPTAAEELRRRIGEDLGIPATVPREKQAIER